MKVKKFEYGGLNLKNAIINSIDMGENGSIEINFIYSRIDFISIEHFDNYHFDKLNRVGIIINSNSEIISLNCYVMIEKVKDNFIEILLRGKYLIQ